MDNQRNLLLAVVLSGLLIFGWDAGMRYFYPQPEVVGASEKVDTPAEQAAIADAPPGERPHSRQGGLIDPRDIAQEEADLEVALAQADRVPIDAPRLAGSVNPTGAVIDDIVLKDHRASVDKDSGPVRIFSPRGTPAQQFAQFGWVGTGVAVPDINTRWQVEGGSLAQGRPVTLTHDNGEGQLFTIRLTVDANYMITAEQTVANTGGRPVVVRPFALVNRTRRTASDDLWVAHSGPIGVFGDSVSYGPDYDDVAEGENAAAGRADWIGFTDIYWLSALVPMEGSQASGDFRALGNDIFRSDLLYQPVTVAPGRQVTRSTQLFAGAKESTVLDGYQDAGIPLFGLAVDWGWFRWFEKPFLWLLKQFNALVGNFGIAIIMLTIVVRGLMFPIAQKQFASMASMKAIQPKMKAIQERHKDDRVKQQQEMQKLFKDEGVNPLAGCLPLILQIPIFFALYKVLILAIEMRHEPFLYIRDLSAPDPATILNLFGLLPFTPPSFLAIGVLAVLLGITMWLTFKMNPSQMDPMQQQIFNIMPWVLMFVMAPFAAGLLLYWVTSNVLTLAQQKYLYSQHPQLRAQAEKDRAEKAKAKAET